MGEKQTAAQAFDAFAQKLQRFISAGGESPSSKKPVTEQEVINTALSAKKKAVIDRYKSFMTPDASVSADQVELKAAYDIFKGVQGINTQHATKDTFLQAADIASPLIHSDRYTIGGDFVYLQSWLFFEQGCKDYIPELQPQPTGDNSYKLAFVPARHHHVTYEEREKQEIIRACFYPEK